ncbi:hypothetical protein T492DRAFT_981380 [Pavlovales sp. CCMP2436]|nr:hypothetical protein T492DRAFT_981380 [Pavlovales sp. CCMP2436]
MSEPGTAAERRGSAEALSEPTMDWPRPRVSEISHLNLRADDMAGAASRAGLNGTAAGESVATPEFTGAIGVAPPSGRSAPFFTPFTPLSPDMTNLSPIHMPSRRLIHVPPMPPLPDPAMGAFFDDTALSPTGREAAEVLQEIALTGSKRPLESPEEGEGEGHEDELDDEYDEEGRSKKLRGSRCGTCGNCLRPDCGVCGNCVDKPKFGGPGVKKQACTARKCTAPNVRGAPLRQPVSLFRSTPPGPQPVPGGAF